MASQKPDTLIDQTEFLARQELDQLRFGTGRGNGLGCRFADAEDGRFHPLPFPLRIDADEIVPLPEAKQSTPELRPLADPGRFVLLLERKNAVSVRGRSLFIGLEIDGRDPGFFITPDPQA